MDFDFSIAASCRRWCNPIHASCYIKIDDAFVSFAAVCVGQYNKRYLSVTSVCHRGAATEPHLILVNLHPCTVLAPGAYFNKTIKVSNQSYYCLGCWHFINYGLDKHTVGCLWILKAVSWKALCFSSAGCYCRRRATGKNVELLEKVQGEMSVWKSIWRFSHCVLTDFKFTDVIGLSSWHYFHEDTGHDNKYT